MTMANWFAFLAVSLAATFSPGPGVLLAISTTLSAGPRRTFFSSAGNGLGIFIVSCVAVTSAGILLRTSESAFAVLKIVGAAYLIYLGIKQWRSAHRLAAPMAAGAVDPATDRGALFMRGLVVALSNPKAILFFTAIFPQFMQTADPNVAQFLLLSLTFVACSFVSHASYVLLARALNSGRFGPSAMRNVNRVSAIVFVGLGCAMLTLSAGQA